MDVAVPARWRPARDQPTARAAREPRQADDDERGRDPQLLRARVPRESRCAAGPGTLPGRLVRADQTWTLSSLLRRILRDEPFGDDRLGRCDATRKVSGMAKYRRRRRLDGFVWAEAVSATALRFVPQDRRNGTLPRARRAFRQTGSIAGWANRDCRRELHPRIYPRSEGEDRGELRTDHAQLHGAAERGGNSATRRLH